MKYFIISGDAETIEDFIRHLRTLVNVTQEWSYKAPDGQSRKKIVYYV